MVFSTPIRAAVLSVSIGLTMSLNAQASSLPKNLQCDRQKEARAKSICQALEQNMEHTLFGHAMISPGYRVTFSTIRKVWCSQSITADDAPILRTLEQAADWRLSSAASDLLILAEKQPQSENSIFNPQHPDYILKSGCR